MAQAILSEPASSGNGSQGIMPVLSLVNGKPRASSLAIAEHFKKRHDNVLRSITQTCHDLPSNFCALNFEETLISVPGPKGSTRQERAYLMTRDGFTLIVMSFTGKEAMAWKLRYIEAFNAMEAEIAGQRTPALPVLARRTTPKERNALATLVNRYVGMLPGSPTPETYKAAWRKVHDVMGIGSIEELTVEQLPRAMAFAQALVDALSLPLPSEEPKALPPALPPLPRRASLDDYRDLFRALPETPAYWDSLLSRFFAASEAFAKELSAIRDEATKPFRVKRKHEVRTYFDAAIAPIFCLLEDAEQAHHMAYRSVYHALEGCQSVWRLLRIG